MNSHILVLNYNGQHLLAECLPSIVAAAREVPDCAVSVVDNGSVDGSLDWLHRNWPEIKVSTFLHKKFIKTASRSFSDGVDQTTR